MSQTGGAGRGGLGLEPGGRGLLGGLLTLRNVLVLVVLAANAYGLNTTAGTADQAAGEAEQARKEITAVRQDLDPLCVLPGE